MEKLYKNKEALKTYLGTPDKVFWYENAFRKYEVNGVEGLSWNWSWSAFFGNAVYLAYRKCYIEAVAVFIVLAVLGAISPVVSLIANIGSGGILPFLVYKRFKKCCDTADALYSTEEDKMEALRNLGGVNRNIVWAYVGLVVVGIILVGSVL